MGSTPDKATAKYADPLDQGNLDALLAGRHGAPFDVLGSHVVVVGKIRLWVVRVFRPYAEAVQSSSDNPATRPNSRWLFVTSTAPAAIA